MATTMRSSAIVAASIPVERPLEHESPLRVGGSCCCGFWNGSMLGLNLEVSRGVQNARRIEFNRGVVRVSMDGRPPLPASHKLKSASLAVLEQLRNASVDRYTSEKSSILVLGLSVHSAPVEMREKLAVPEAEWPRAIGELCGQNHIEEAAVLSTCNRMEIYVVALSWHRGAREVTEWMSKTSGIPIDELREHLFVLRDRDATQHLFRVASGLDSLVLGEGQILAQVKQVFKIGQGALGFGRNLSGLFKQAITAGKRVRSETSIAAGAVSVSSAAVELAAMKRPEEGLFSARILVVGAGKMSKLLVKHLISKGCARMAIVNRTEQKVQDLQAEFRDAELMYYPLTEMLRCAEDADVIFTSTASERPLFYKENVENLSEPSNFSSRVRLFIDISVPRNVGACVAQVASARLYNVDDLKEVVAANKEERRRKALEAQVIIEEELKSFEAWRDSLETVPTIKKLRAYAENIRVNELEKCLSKIGENLSKKDRKLIEDLSKGIVNKLLHGPMQHLRSDGSDARTVNETLENMHALERMFDLKSEIASIEQQFRARAENLSS
ncbi:hypothetical protein O6H91_14G008200 [Diphasiastrum complanatum]|uniref:Uncharacterized protein n=1 Tax=Diphasiastrum complanatum TaxID=34168 RepID=A0ACC2BLE3_DIPCM|nr:hypothetical protein O6H91_Y091400 [Diphasiastrum complanatum]KAJ7530566.1 hypothetical protein O6H91_14G008200 [Diphasiastrum complanatum]